VYEQDRRDSDVGRDLDEKAAVAPRRRYEASRRSAEPDLADPPVPDLPAPRPPRRHRYADESAPAASRPADMPTVPVLAPEPEVDRAQLNRIAQFFRGAETEKAKDKPKTEPAPAPPREGASVWNTQATQELKPYIPEQTGESRVNGSAQVEDDEAVLIAVRELTGVHDAELYTDPTGARRLRLDLDTAADPDAVTAKATRLLADRLGVRAQPRTTQAYHFPRPVGPGGTQTRAVVEQVQVSTSGFETTVEVGLNVEGHRAVGRATGPAVDWHVLRTTADATIDAVASLLGNRGRCVVEHASVVPAGALRVAVVVVLLLTEAGAEQLAGAAPVAGDNRQAMVHATMSALNRRLEVLLP